MRGVANGAVLVAAALAGCGGQGAVTPHDGSVTTIASPDFCAALVEAACDRGARCGTAPPDRPTCRVELTRTFDGCPLMVEAVVRDETDYDEAAAALYVEETRSGACTESVPDPIALGVFTPRKEEGQICHSKASCKAGLVCDGLTTSTPEGTCRAQ